MNKTRFVVTTALAAFAFAGAAAVPQAAAAAGEQQSATAQALTSSGVQAVRACWEHADNFRWWCYNGDDIPVFANKSNTFVVGVLESNPSWFYCRSDDGQNHGGPHPRRWLSTVADNGERGWVSDNDIASETNPVRVCRPGS